MRKWQRTGAGNSSSSRRRGDLTIQKHRIKDTETNTSVRTSVHPSVRPSVHPSPPSRAQEPDWLGLRPARLALGPSRGGIVGRMDGWTDGWMYGWKISPFYRTSSPTGAVAQKQPYFDKENMFKRLYKLVGRFVSLQ